MSKEFKVKGMSCTNCEETVEQSLENIEEIKSAMADHETDTVIVEGDPEVTDLIKAVEDVGYTAYA